MSRITIKNLNEIVNTLNRITNSPNEPYKKDESGMRRAQVGSYYIGQAYGGYTLLRIINSGGGCNQPLASGYIPARELCEHINAYIRGLRDAKTIIH
jgi:hypothetical protein